MQGRAEILTPAPTSIRRATGAPRNSSYLSSTHRPSPASDETAISPSTRSGPGPALVHGTGNTAAASNFLGRISPGRASRSADLHIIDPAPQELRRSPVRTICIRGATVLKANKVLVRSQGALVTGLDQASCRYRWHISVHLRTGR